ncbi:MAG: fructose-bisphosphate aldolase class I [Candidatus Doudnabacteria bacterium]|nr:fructose-bisphosphate aldolase class I [Candidatus Doudnabacteria bacterium]
MNKEELSKIAKQMVAEGKGILAADESMNTVGKRFAAINLENTEDNRRAFREMLLTAPGEGEYVSGVILFDETIRQKTSSGKSFVEVLNSEGILPGIKVDQGLVEVGESGEKITKGLDGLAERLKEYSALGAKFCKWRSVITIGEGTPTEENIRQNAKDLASYALECQKANLVPMVEPEVLLEGSHSIEQAKDASGRILTALFEELNKAGVLLEGLILKTSMVLPGKNYTAKASPEEIAKETIEVFARVLPNNLAGVVFLSGGQGEIEATENLNAINSSGKQPWSLTFSYARALQDGATKAWSGEQENMEIAQKTFMHRAKMNSLASLGKYSKEMEEGFASSTGGEVTQD